MEYALEDHSSVLPRPANNLQIAYTPTKAGDNYQFSQPGRRIHAIEFSINFQHGYNILRMRAIIASDRGRPMRKTQRHLLLALLLLELCLLSSCQFKWPSFQPAEKLPLDIGDGGFLSGKPCDAPCFWNITPDVTTREQAKEIFQKQFDISNCDVWPGLRNGQYIMCDPVWIRFGVSDKVDHIGYSPVQTITVEEAIAKYGQPNAVKVLGWSEENMGGTTSVTMLLFFDNIRTAVGLSRQSGTNYKVELSTQIDGINYESVSKWEGMGKGDRQSWTGFGTYPGPNWAGP